MDQSVNGIVCAGNWILDRVKTIDRFPPEGESCRVRSLTTGGGGGACNVFFDLRAMDPALALYPAGCVGDDASGRFLLEKLEAVRADLRYMTVVPGCPTAQTDVLSGEGKRTFVICDGANAHFDGGDIRPSPGSSGIFYLGYLLLLEQLDAPDSEFGTGGARLLHRMRRAGLTTVVDFVAADPVRYRQVIPPAMAYTDVLVINELEAGYSCGLELRDASGGLHFDRMECAARQFLAWGVRKYVIFHYPEGAMLMDAAGAVHTAASYELPREEIAGSNGAGDAFCAGILYGLWRKDAPLAMLQLAGASAWNNLHSPSACDGAAPLEVLLSVIERHQLVRKG